MDEFKNQSIIVTGGASGIGKATVELFASNGAQVYMADINEKDGIRLMSELNAKNQKVIFIKTNVTKFDELEILINKVITEFGKIDIIFNNAGFEGRVKKIQDTSPKEWDEVMDLNVKGCFMACKLVIPHMVKNGGGCIINIGSELGLSFRFAENYVPYSTSKAAVIAFTKALAIELAAYKIRVNCVSPGSINTPMVEREVQMWLERGLYKTKEYAMKAIISAYPAGNIGEPADIANAVAYLASDRAKFITGTVLCVDGGGAII
ncbi:MAG: SDR family oxidoreductase [Actinobacteria bacterium]|nr:SDR family oxidoreductase [Actinomycetota bacterium]